MHRRQRVVFVVVGLLLVVALVAPLLVGVAGAEPLPDDPAQRPTIEEVRDVEHDREPTFWAYLFPLGGRAAIATTLWFSRRGHQRHREDDEARIRERRRVATERALAWEERRAAQARRKEAEVLERDRAEAAELHERAVALERRKDERRRAKQRARTPRGATPGADGAPSIGP